MLDMLLITGIVLCVFSIAYDVVLKKMEDRKQLQQQEAVELYREFRRQKFARRKNEESEVVAMEQKLKKALRLDPENIEIRLQLYKLYGDKSESFNNPKEKRKKLIEEGLQTDIPDNQKQFLKRLAVTSR
ncbi:MAG: hypothetical protein ACLFN5_07670 [bacterium]